MSVRLLRLNPNTIVICIRHNLSMKQEGEPCSTGSKFQLVYIVSLDYDCAIRLDVGEVRLECGFPIHISSRSNQVSSQRDETKEPRRTLRVH